MTLVAYQPETTIEFATTAWDTAQRIARTEFVPKALHGKPEAVLAAMLTGHELGIGPMQALSKIHVIEGRPSIAAELMRGLILRAGHELWFEEQSTTRCTIVGRRADSQRETRMTWTLDDAKRARLDGKPNWRTYPADMLVARATGRLARAIFPDVIAGMSYTLEELTDGDVINAEDMGAAGAAGAALPAPARSTAKARRAATRSSGAVSAPAPVAAATPPPLPGEDGYDDVLDVVEAAPPAAPYEGPDQELPARPTSLASQVAMWCNDLHAFPELAYVRELYPATDDFRHALLAAYSEGAYSSGTELPPAEINAFKATGIRLKRGDVVLEDRDGTPVLVSTVTGLPSSDPGGQSPARRGGPVDPDAATTPSESSPAATRPPDVVEGHTEASPVIVNADDWRALMKARNLRVSDVMKMAAQAAPDLRPDQLPGNLAALVTMPDLAEKVLARIEAS